MTSHSLIASLVALCLFGVPAFAADLTVKAPPSPIPEWTGFYVGIHGGGYGWARPGLDDDDLNAELGDPSLHLSKLKGWVFGGHAGYNWQVTRWVGGLEIDYSAANMSDSQARSASFDFFGTHIDATRMLSAKLDGLASARARLGVRSFQNCCSMGQAASPGDIRHWI